MAFGLRRDLIKRLEGLAAEWCFIAVIMLYPIIAGSTILLGLPNRPIAVLYRAGYLLLALLVIVFEITSWDKKVKYYSKYVACLAAFWAVYLGRMCYDLLYLKISSAYILGKGFPFYFQYGILGSFIPALAIALAVRQIDFKRLHKNMRIVSLPLMLMLFYVIYKDYGLSADIFINRIALGDDDAKTITPIIMSRHGAIVCVVTLYYMLLNKISAFDVALFVLGFLILVLGASRGPMIAALVSMALMCLHQLKLKFKKLSTWRNVVLFLGILVIAFVRYYEILLENVSLFHRVELSVNQEQGVSERVYAWSAAWNQFLSSPVYGDKVVENHFGFYPHNIILEVLMSTGLIGLFLLLPMFYKACVNLFVIQDLEKRMIVYLFVMFFIFVFFSSALITIPHFWVVFSLLVALSPSYIKSAHSR